MGLSSVSVVRHLGFKNNYNNFEYEQNLNNRGAIERPMNVPNFVEFGLLCRCRDMAIQ